MAEAVTTLPQGVLWSPEGATLAALASTTTRGRAARWWSRATAGAARRGRGGHLPRLPAGRVGGARGGGGGRLLIQRAGGAGAARGRGGGGLVRRRPGRGPGAPARWPCCSAAPPRPAARCSRWPPTGRRARWRADRRLRARARRRGVRLHRAGGERRTRSGWSRAAAERRARARRGRVRLRARRLGHRLRRRRPPREAGGPAGGADPADGRAPSLLAREVGEFRWAAGAPRLAWLEKYDPRVRSGTRRGGRPRRSRREPSRRT